MIYIYSKENLFPILTETRGDNGDVLNTVSFNRKNRNLKIYIKFSLNGSVIPTVNRGYFDGDKRLQYHSKQYNSLSSADGEAIFDYDMFNDKNFRCFNLEFECIEDGTTFIITEIGVRFDTIDSTVDNTLNQSLTKLMKDINGDPLSEQKYTKLNNFSLNMNRVNVDGVFNVIEKPFYLVDVKDCVDNSTSNEVSCTEPTIEYLTTATKKCKVTLNNIVSTVPRKTKESNILNVNNNILRESDFSLRIINGESADVYIESDRYPGYFIKNFNLNFSGYWQDFLNNTDSVHIPLVDVHSMTKAHSLWYRNTGSLFDSCVVEVASDYRNNIIEFINRSVKSASLSFDSIEELIFVLEVRFINSVGRTSTKPLFVGRPEIKTNSDSQLIFDVKSLDYQMLKNAPFASYVLEANSGSFHNFIDLYQGFANIYNNPHYLNDEYVYPVVPFNLNEGNYVPKDTNLYLNDIDIIPANYTIYAEDFVIGDENRKQIFYYRDSPECGIVDIIHDDKGNYLSSDTFNLGSMRMFTNASGVNFTGDLKKINDHMFRTMRPIRTFIVDDLTDIVLGGFNTLQTGYIDNDHTLGTDFAVTDEFRVDLNDEIIVMEQLVELIKSSTDNELGYVCLFLNTSNIFYYNKTKNIFYWTPIVNQALSTPFPSLWFDLRLDGYFGLTMVYNNYFLYNPQGFFPPADSVWEADFNSRIFTRTPFMIVAKASVDDENPYKYQLSKRINSFQRLYMTMNKNNSIGFEIDVLDRWIRQWVEPNENVFTEWIEKTDAITQFKPKSVVLDKEKSIHFNWPSFDASGAYNNIIVCETPYNAWTQLSKTLFTYPEIPLGSNYKPQGHIYEVSSDLSCAVTNTILLGSDFKAFGLYTGFHARLHTDYKTDFAYKSVNSHTYNGDYYYFDAAGVIWIYNGVAPSFVYRNYANADIRILDVNIELDRVIYILSGEIYYAKLISNALIFKDDSNLAFLLATNRTFLSYSNTVDNSIYSTLQQNSEAPIRLLSFDGNRYNASIGLANSFFKNMYSDNLGIKQIGIAPTTKIKLTDAEIVPNSFISTTEQYNQIEWKNYNTIKNKFTGIDNDTATTKESDNQNYDRSFSISCYSSEDVQMSIKLVRDANGYNWTVTNEFGTEPGFIDPPNYQTFDIELTGKFLGIKIYFNFYDGEIGVGETFRGEIEKRVLEQNKIADKIISANKKFIWQDDKVFALKFPFLNNKYSPSFFDVAEEYFVDSENNTIRKLLTVSLMIPELILFNENYSIFNIGDVDVEIDSITKYLNGYYVDGNGDIQKYNSNKAGFKIEKILYNFKQRQTIFKLVSH